MQEYKDESRTIPAQRVVTNLSASFLSQLILDVQDIDKSLAFYHGMLHLPIRDQQDCDGHRLAYLGEGFTQLLLLQQPKEDQPLLIDRSGGLVINFRVRDLRGMADDLIQHKVTVLRSLDMAEIGERTFLVADPDGYAVLLSEPVETLH